MTVTYYDIGDRPIIKAEFVDEDGTATDPTGITWKIIDPAGTIATPEDETDATNPAVGEWRWPIPEVLALEGWYFVEVKATAGIACAEAVKFLVRASQFD